MGKYLKTIFTTFPLYMYVMNTQRTKQLQICVVRWVQL